MEVEVGGPPFIAANGRTTLYPEVVSNVLQHGPVDPGYVKFQDFLGISPFGL